MKPPAFSRASEPLPRSHRLVRGAGILAMALTLAFLSSARPAAAEDDKRATREREALRRSQLALRSAQESQAALQRDKAGLVLERDKLDAESKRTGKALEGAQAQSRQARGDLARAQAALAAAQAELEKAREESQRARTTLQTRLDELERGLADARRQLAERTASNTTIAALLARSTEALTDAERRNRELYSLGRKLLDELRGEAGGLREPFLQLGRIENENRAEELRSQIDKQQIVMPPAEVPAPRQQGAVR